MSQDPNAERLATSEWPDIVVSVSALKEIADNFAPGYERGWIIPFTVRTYEPQEGKGKPKKKVSFFQTACMTLKKGLFD